MKRTIFFLLAALALFAGACERHDAVELEGAHGAPAAGHAKPNASLPLAPTTIHTNPGGAAPVKPADSRSSAALATPATPGAK